MKNRRNKKKKIMFISAGAAAVILVLFLIIRGIFSLTAPQADTEKGLDYIRSAEESDLSSIESKMNQMEQPESAEEDTRNVKGKFFSSVVMGDSIAAGFEAYSVLEPSSVIAENSVLLSDADEQIKRVEALKPQIIFLTYGLNDMAQDKEDAETFADQYEGFILSIQKAVPGAHIFVNSIFPVQEKVLEEEPLYENIPAYNTALEELCGRLQVGYIDNTSLVQDDDYEQDGIHFQEEFYSVWAQHMAEVAAL